MLGDRTVEGNGSVNQRRWPKRGDEGWSLSNGLAVGYRLSKPTSAETLGKGSDAPIAAIPECETEGYGFDPQPEIVLAMVGRSTEW